MAEAFPHVFSPLRMGVLKLQHRIYVTAHNVGTADINDLPDERAVQYYLARARGGAAMLFSGGSPVHRSAYSPSGKCWATWDQRFPAALKRVTEAVGEHGVPFILQLHHHGGYGTSRRHELPLLSASDTRVLRTRREPPHEIEHHQIREIARAFGESAARAREGGASGVEVICGSNGLIMEFISPQLNRREDEYGGSEENRLRFYSEVMDSIRSEVGDDFPVGIKVTGDDLEPGALSLEDHLRIVPKMVQRGKITWVGLFMGYMPSFKTWTLNVPPQFVAPGYNKHIAQSLREVLTVPLMFSGRVTHPRTAEQLLSEGYADMVGMTRAHLSDPDLVNKTREGRADEIRTCIGINICVGRRERNTFLS